MSCGVSSNNSSLTFFKTEVKDEENIDNKSVDDLDLSDASTIVNVSLLVNKDKNTTRKRKCNSESEGLAETIINNDISVAQEDLTEDQEGTDAVNQVVKEVSFLGFLLLKRFPYLKNQPSLDY